MIFEMSIVGCEIREAWDRNRNGVREATYALKSVYIYIYIYIPSTSPCP